MQLVTQLESHTWLQSYFPRIACSGERSGLLHSGRCIHVTGTALADTVRGAGPPHCDPTADRSPSQGSRGPLNPSIDSSENALSHQESPPTRLSASQRAGPLVPALPTPQSKRAQMFGGQSPLLPPQEPPQLPPDRNADWVLLRELVNQAGLGLCVTSHCPQIREQQWGWGGGTGSGLGRLGVAPGRAPPQLCKLRDIAEPLPCLGFLLCQMGTMASTL